MLDNIDDDLADLNNPTLLTSNLPRSLSVLNIAELLKLEIPVREPILAPWLPTKGLAMVYAKRGVGKTLFALEVAWAVASGGAFLKWRAPHPRCVLYIDGEMPLSLMQQRVADIVKRGQGAEPDSDKLKLLSADYVDRGLNLSDKACQLELEPLLTGVELIVVDNISTLGAYGRENEGESWLPLQEWALTMRRRNIAVLFIHHAGKNGGQRGTSRREDVLDTVIALKELADDNGQNSGASFEVHFEKQRRFFGEDTRPLAVSLQPQGWTWRELKDAMREKVAALKAEGHTHRDIADELGISPAKVTRILKQQSAERLLNLCFFRPLL